MSRWIRISIACLTWPSICAVAAGDQLPAPAGQLAAPAPQSSSGDPTQTETPESVSAHLSGQTSPSPDPAALEFFEQRIRPIFVEHCSACHGAEKQEAGLRLETQAGFTQGSDHGPVVVPGKPQDSRLWRAMRYEDEALQMPPDGRLPERAITDLTAWITAGAPWPDATLAPDADGDTASSTPGEAALSRQWAFGPLRRAALPTVRRNDWVQSPIDQFVLAKLEQAGLEPSQPAPRRILIRRLYFDLVGLPPTYDELEDWAMDSSPDWLAKLVDHLLASPQYGERWGRHWLDVARYADNKGYQFFGSNEFYAYTYRDWVIRALNDDLPYDQFVTQQLAADCLPLGDDRRALAALGYLTLGRRFLEDVHDIIDDRIDVVTRGLMGLTVTCARCHDHKFDPIPMADYYSLYGVFAASAESTRSLYVGSQLTMEERAFEEKLRGLEVELDAYLRRRHTDLRASFRKRIAEYLLAGHQAQSTPPMDRFMYVEVPDKLSQLVIGRWRAWFDQTERTWHLIFGPWQAFARLKPHEYSTVGSELARSFAANGQADRQLNPHVAALFASSAPANLEDLAARYAALLINVDDEWNTLAAAASATGSPPADRLPDADREALRKVLYGPLAPPDVPLSEVEFLVGRPGQAEIAELRKKITECKATSPKPLARSMVLEEVPDLYRYNPRIFIRGKPTNLGPEVPRQFLAVVAGADRRPFAAGGRLDLARAIVSPDNPLAARVFVNRVWAHHMGAGLVSTPSDFGVRSEPPSHPELLDYLAGRFMDEGWSIKNLHRWIVLTSTYQQASADRPEAVLVDPDNRLLWKMPRRRLEFEPLRDSLLQAAGALDLTAGGPAISLASFPFSQRRTIYGLVDRQNLPGMFSAFDFANPDAHSPRRFSTTVPQQALFLMNSPFVIEQARRLAGRTALDPSDSPGARIERMYRQGLSRDPTREETRLAARFLESAVNGTEISAWQYGFGSYDQATSRVTSFTPLSHWTGAQWQAGPALPDPTHGWVMLDAQGGHPGADDDHQIIRRWTAPAAGQMAIAGELVHDAKEGNGVRARVVSGRAGCVGEWTAMQSRAMTTIDLATVMVGDTIDFVVDSQGDIVSDQHLWAPVIRLTVNLGASGLADGPLTSGPAVTIFGAAADFAGPALSPWEALAQVLLVSNEFAYVD